MTTDLHPNTAAALAELDQSRKMILAADADAKRIAGIMAEHPRIQNSGGLVQPSGNISYTLFPDSMGDITALLKDLRGAYADQRYDVKQDPDRSQMHYWIGPMYLCVFLNRKCTFKKVGTKTVETPVYELSCE